MKLKNSLLLLLALSVAASASAQSGGKYSASPTDQDYRLVVVEPKAGATVTGETVTIVLGQPPAPSGQPPAQATSEPKQRAMNTPTFQVWVDGRDYGNIPIGQNVFTVRDLSYGPHKIVVAAKNIAGELVDRKELSITTVEATAQAAAPPPPPPAPAPEPAPATEPAPAQEPAPPAAPSEQLPATGTWYPMLALAGAALLGAGILLRRKF